MTRKVDKTEEQWRRELPAGRYAVLRERATEPPFSGEYAACKEPGTYRCGGCGAALFDSDAKFESGTGWPSFYEPASEEAVATALDTSHGMTRVEALCAACGGHLGHVFDDGPEPTGLRFCINSAALELDRGS